MHDMLQAMLSTDISEEFQRLFNIDFGYTYNGDEMVIALESATPCAWVFDNDHISFTPYKTVEDLMRANPGVVEMVLSMSRIEYLKLGEPIYISGKTYAKIRAVGKIELNKI